MKEIIIFSHVPFSKRDHHRFGVDILKRNFSVKVIDCSAWIYKDHRKEFLSQYIFRSKEYISISCKEDFLELISKFNSPIVIDRLPYNNETNWMRKL